jgi:hypothetical protein
MMGNHHLIFGYRGTLSNDLISAIIQLADSKLKEMDAPFRQKKSVINIMIEGLQNSLFHAIETGTEKSHECVFLLSRKDKAFLIRMGNFIESGKEAELRRKIEELNSLDADEIQQRYLDVLDHGQLSDKGGAGLGFLRMLRDSGNPIGYSFEASNGKQVFYTIEILVSEQAGK